MKKLGEVQFLTSSRSKHFQPSGASLLVFPLSRNDQGSKDRGHAEGGGGV